VGRGDSSGGGSSGSRSSSTRSSGSRISSSSYGKHSWHTGSSSDSDGGRTPKELIAYILGYLIAAVSAMLYFLFGLPRIIADLLTGHSSKVGVGEGMIVLWVVLVIIPIIIGYVAVKIATKPIIRALSRRKDSSDNSE
jgi:hypothetical protein